MTGFEQSFEALLQTYGTLALFVTLTLETFGLPLPGESALILAATAASAGKLDIWTVGLAAFCAAVLGDNIAYCVGRRYGRTAILRAGRRFGVTEAGFARAEAMTARYGPIIVAAARFIVLLRQLNGLVAGTVRMPWPHFLFANVVGAAAWVGFWTLLAYRFGQDAHRFLPWIWHHLSLIAMVVIPALILVAVLLRRRHGSR